MTNLQKSGIVTTIENEIHRIGSANKFANKCGASPAIISQMRNGEWERISNGMWHRVASRSGHVFSNWQIAETTNYRLMQKVLNDAKGECLFVPVSYRAGAGKTEGLKGWMRFNNRDFNYMLKCRQWAAREFIENLIQELGLEIPKGYMSVDKLGQVAIDRFIELKEHIPLLALDQANSLKPSALKFLIHLYNELEDEMSVVIVGTENLETEIKRGVRYNKHGYDEIDSRFGRNYIHLIGSTKTDVAAICEANGITDKKLHKDIFDECGPRPKKVGDQFIHVVEDTRRVKRIIKREKIKLKNSNYEAVQVQP
ncbi:ATP-binding protein [Flagellimonas onchidii]|uniref:ATP-binding protein n=1 Tax=Flagellimonas onchidii TaxID=2562684 RepID=UPI0010A6B64D|nr:ATP-binding protein [Allomuricauda onchidii]